MVYRVDLGRVPYAEALALQHRLVQARRERRIPDTLLLLEHPPVFTLGTSARPEHILASSEMLDALGIEVFTVERGGDVTYHGPDQLVMYPILDLRGFRQDISWYVRSLEEVVILTLAAFEIPARRVGVPANDGKRDSKYVGVWVDNPDPARAKFVPEAKVAQFGVRNENWVVYHGLALNVAPNLEHFQLIVPCGISDKPVTSMSQILGRPLDMAAVRDRAASAFAEVFATSLLPILPGQLESELAAGHAPAGF